MPLFLQMKTMDKSQGYDFVAVLEKFSLFRVLLLKIQA